MTILKTVEDLEAIYGRPGETSLVKELDRIIPEYAAFIEASPFVALATAGPEGLDCSPRGDLAGFVRIEDERTLLMPDRHGNNRTDSLRNIVRDGGSGCCSWCRVRARRCASTAARICHRRRAQGLLRRRRQAAALGHGRRNRRRLLPVRSRHPSLRLWNPARHADPKSLPTPGAILASVSANRIGGETYDREWPERAKKTMW